MGAVLKREKQSYSTQSAVPLLLNKPVLISKYHRGQVYPVVFFWVNRLDVGRVLFCHDLFAVAADVPPHVPPPQFFISAACDTKSLTGWLTFCCGITSVSD